MSKKDFKTGFDALLGEKKNTPNSDLKEEVNIVVTTIKTDVETLQKLRGIAYWERIKLKEVINAAFKDYINNYEATKGYIQLVSKDKT
jgi:hypothetical protein